MLIPYQIRSKQLHICMLFKPMRGVNVYKCNEITRTIWLWCIEEILTSASHIQGSQNVIADKASRTFNEHTEWQLDRTIFHELMKSVAIVPKVDLFASRLNKHMDKYVSWKQDLSAIFVDDFSTE